MKQNKGTYYHVSEIMKEFGYKVTPKETPKGELLRIRLMLTKAYIKGYSIGKGD